jgi:hypothetical protein
MRRHDDGLEDAEDEDACVRRVTSGITTDLARRTYESSLVRTVFVENYPTK